MSALDELREAIFRVHADDALFINDRAELDPLGADYIPEARVTAAIDAFEAAHPTLHEAGDCWEVFDDTDRATGEDYRGIRQRYPACATAD